jgi:hypothetical protein
MGYTLKSLFTASDVIESTILHQPSDTVPSGSKAKGIMKK